MRPSLSSVSALALCCFRCSRRIFRRRMNHPFPPARARTTTFINSRNNRPKCLYTSYNNVLEFRCPVPFRNRPFLSSARTTHVHSTAQQPTKAPTYLHTTAFWNSDRQFHSGMVTESIIPPAPAAHNTIAFINPDATYQSACLPTYHNILELWWPVPFRNHLTTTNSGKLKAENPELSAAEQKRQNVRRTYEHTRVVVEPFQLPHKLHYLFRKC